LFLPADRKRRPKQLATATITKVAVDTGDGWQTVVRVAGHYQRLRAHELPKVPVQRLRITVTATNGIDHAPITEERVE
jgi:hypothetical protein